MVRKVQENEAAHLTFVTSLKPIRLRRETQRSSTAGLTTWSEIFLQSLCKARSSKDLRTISLDVNKTQQDTRKTERDVT
jgi:hypothetical protein